MHTTQAVQVYHLVDDPDLEVIMRNVVGQLAPTSRKTYSYDARHFAFWMADHSLTFQSLSRDDLVAYSVHLAETYAKATASRMWAVARRLFDEAVQRQVLAKNPAGGG